MLFFLPSSQQVQHCQRQVEREQVVLKQQEKECQLFEARIDALTKERDALEKGKELAMKKVPGSGDWDGLVLRGMTLNKNGRKLP